MPCHRPFVRITTIRGRGSRFMVAPLVATLVAACGSVPKVIFADEPNVTDAGASQEGSTSPQLDDGATDASREAGGGSELCPDTAPTGGICCGELPCIGCRNSHCNDCREKNCVGNTVCCPTEQSKV